MYRQRRHVLWVSASILIANALLVILIFAASAAQPSEALPMPKPLVQATRHGKRPAQTATRSDITRSDLHHPQRSESSKRTRNHLYSPSNGHNNRRPPCPSSRCEPAPGEFLIKVGPNVTLNAPRSRPPVANLGSLNALFAAHRVSQAVRVFPAARKPLAGARKRVGGEDRPIPDLTRWYRLTLPKDSVIEQVVAAFDANPHVEYAEPNYVFTFDSTPNDPYFYPNLDKPEPTGLTYHNDTSILAQLETVPEGVER